MKKMEHLDPQIDTCSTDKKKVLLCVCKLSVLITYIKIMMYGSTTSSSGNSLCTWTHPIVASELRDDQPHIALILMNAFLDHNFNINLISGVIFQQKRYINAHKKKEKNNCLRSHFLTRDKLLCD